MTTLLARTVREVLETHSEHVSVPVRGRAGALVCFALSIVTIIVALVAEAFLTGTPLSPLALSLLSIGVGLAVVGRRMWLPDALTLLRRDTRPPVLYLRSFAHNDIPNTREDLWETFSNPFGYLFKTRMTSSMEAQVCDVLRSIGPVITASRSDEVFNVSAAARLKIADSHWQQIIGDLIDACDLLVADASGTVANSSSVLTGPHWREAGLRWEVEHASSSLNRRKLLFALPVGRLKGRRDAFAYNHVCELMSEVFGYRLPDHQGDLAFISFARDGSPVEHHAGVTSSVSGLVFGRFRTTLANALREAGYAPRRLFGRRLSQLGARLLIPAAAILSVWAVIESVESIRADAAAARKEFQANQTAAQEYVRVDQQWRRDFSTAVAGIGARGGGPWVATVLEARIIPVLRTEQQHLASRHPISAKEIELNDELGRHVTRAIEEVERFAAAARANDDADAARALQLLRQNDQGLEEFLKTYSGRSN